MCFSTAGILKGIEIESMGGAVSKKRLVNARMVGLALDDIIIIDMPIIIVSTCLFTVCPTGKKNGSQGGGGGERLDGCFPT